VATPDASRNISYQFDADKFRNAIRFVFEMAEPPENGLEVMFHFVDVITVPGIADGDQVPFDPNVTPTRVTKAPLNVPCQVEFLAASDTPTAFGTIVPAKLKILLLDVDYLLVSTASFVVLNGDRYNRQYEEPSTGLFDVGLHTMVFVAENEL
jgi:hypothetical protein